MCRGKNKPRTEMMSDRNASRSNELDLNRFELEGSVLRIIITAAAIAAATSCAHAQIIQSPPGYATQSAQPAAPPNTSRAASVRTGTKYQARIPHRR